MLTQKRLKELVVYNPCTGDFAWKASRSGVIRLDKKAGCVRQEGKRLYRLIRVNRVLYRAARLAWLYIYGEWPNIVDHIDGNSTNDSIWNLKNGTQLDNMRNPKAIINAREAALNRYHKQKWG